MFLARCVHKRHFLSPTGKKKMNGQLMVTIEEHTEYVYLEAQTRVRHSVRSGAPNMSGRQRRRRRV